MKKKNFIKDHFIKDLSVLVAVVSVGFELNAMDSNYGTSQTQKQHLNQIEVPDILDVNSPEFLKIKETVTNNIKQNKFKFYDHKNRPYQVDVLVKNQGCLTDKVISVGKGATGLFSYFSTQPISDQNYYKMIETSVESNFDICPDVIVPKHRETIYERQAIGAITGKEYTGTQYTFCSYYLIETEENIPEVQFQQQQTVSAINQQQEESKEAEDSYKKKVIEKIEITSFIADSLSVEEKKFGEKFNEVFNDLLDYSELYKNGQITQKNGKFDFVNDLFQQARIGGTPLRGTPVGKMFLKSLITYDGTFFLRSSQYNSLFQHFNICAKEKDNRTQALCERNISFIKFSSDNNSLISLYFKQFDRSLMGIAFGCPIETIAYLKCFLTYVELLSMKESQDKILDLFEVKKEKNLSAPIKKTIRLLVPSLVHGQCCHAVVFETDINLMIKQDRPFINIDSINIRVYDSLFPGQPWFSNEKAYEIENFFKKEIVPFLKQNTGQNGDIVISDFEYKSLSCQKFSVVCEAYQTINILLRMLDIDPKTFSEHSTYTPLIQKLYNIQNEWNLNWNLNQDFFQRPEEYFDEYPIYEVDPESEDADKISADELILS